MMFYSILPFKDTEQWDYILRNGTLYDDTIHHFHTVRPRIVFETPEFSYADRLKAINLAKEAGFYSDSNRMSKFFDIGKDLAGAFQRYFPAVVSDRIYLMMKNFYRRSIWKN